MIPRLYGPHDFKISSLIDLRMIIQLMTSDNENSLTSIYMRTGVGS